MVASLAFLLLSLTIKCCSGVISNDYTSPQINFDILICLVVLEYAFSRRSSCRGVNRDSLHYSVSLEQRMSIKHT